jgi:hypothetical protein
VHSAIAFAVYHDWSQRAAYDHTAAQTARVTGVAWGGGLYATYVFLALWMADAAWWWVSPRSYAVRPRALTLLISGLALFMFFNATVVFGGGVDRVLGVVATAVVVIAATLPPTRRRAPDTS